MMDPPASHSTHKYHFKRMLTPYIQSATRLFRTKTLHPSSSMSSILNVAIVGAGPVALALANILQVNSIPFKVFEASPSFRTEGGNLDLHPHTGQVAIKEAGVWEAFKEKSRPEADCEKVVLLDGQVLWDDNEHERPVIEGEAKFNGRPEIDRRSLMKILFENLSQDKVALGKKLQKVEQPSPSEQQYTLHFADGSQESGFNLVVGGDGTWSKVRQFLSPIKPQYSGISMIECWSKNENLKDWTRDYVGEGTMFSFGQDRAVVAQKQGDGSVRTYACLRCPEDFVSTCGINWEDTETARKEFMERYFAHIGADLKRLVFECNDSLIPRPLYELPIGFTWEHSPGVTLIGDAAHVMTPFAGVGVNVGLTDALVLAMEIIKASKGEISIDQALKTYEREMFPRARKNMERTQRGKEHHFSDAAAKQFAYMLSLRQR